MDKDLNFHFMGLGEGQRQEEMNSDRKGRTPQQQSLYDTAQGREARARPTASL